MVIFLLILLIPVSYLFYKSTYGVYKHNRLHERWETRIVKTETGKFQVQCWQHDSADWYCEDLEKLYAKVKAQTNLEFEVHEIINKLKYV